MDEIKGIARVKIHAGKLDEWKRLTKQAMEIVRARDPGTLQYEVFFNDDESEAIVFERYRDADAALEHFTNIGHLMEPLMATATVTGEVLGTPNETMRAQLGDGEPKLFTPWMAAHDQTTLTVVRLGVPPTLARTLRSSNAIESMIEICRDHSSNVKRWRDGDMVLRWCAAGMLEASKQFRRVNGFLHLPALRKALEAHVAGTVSAPCEDEEVAA